MLLPTRPRLSEFNSQDLANTSWAFSTADVEAGEFFDAMTVTFRPRVADFNSQDLANTAWTFATADVEAGEFFDAMTVTFRPRLSEFNCQDLANTAHEFFNAITVAAGLRLDSPTRRGPSRRQESKRAIAVTARPLLFEFTSQHLANRAFACVDSKNAQLFSRLMGALRTNHSDLFDIVFVL